MMRYVQFSIPTNQFCTFRMFAFRRILQLQVKYVSMVDYILEHIRFDTDDRGRLEGYK